MYTEYDGYMNEFRRTIQHGRSETTHESARTHNEGSLSDGVVSLPVRLSPYIDALSTSWDFGLIS